MDIKKAYNVIGLDQSSSEDDLKNKYKELAKKYHPDIYKEDPEKFKQINEAYQFIQEYRTNPGKHERVANNVRYSNFGIDINDILSGFRNHTQRVDYERQPPTINIDISFNQSITGTEKDIIYNRFIKCTKCGGEGHINLGNGCQSCDGFGRTVTQGNGVVFSRVCTKCFGRNVKKDDCVACDTEGVVKSEIKGSVHVPPGVSDKSKLRLQGSGHFAGASVFGDAYGDVIINVHVPKHASMSLSGQNVISTLKISLADALTGTTRTVETVHGDKEVLIKKLSKNKDEININGCGVSNTTGTHKVILDVEYPENTEELLNFLRKNN